MVDVSLDTNDMTNNNKQLSVINDIDDTLLPTNKHHVSYSEFSDWYDCSYRHKLKNIDKINLDSQSIHTTFGHVLHEALQFYATNRVLEPIEETIKKLEKGIEELATTENAITAVEAKEFIDAVEPILLQAPGWLEHEFPGWELISAEEELYEPVEGQKNKFFKGFIDLVIKVPKMKKGTGTRLSALKGEKVEDKWVYYIIDWKTTNFGWRTEQKRSFQKHMQLVFYKHFWCTKHDVDIKDVRCGFAFLRRKARKDGTRIDILPISVGPKAIEKAIAELHNCLNQINAKRYFKNKMSCRFCKYAGTSHCP